MACILCLTLFFFFWLSEGITDSDLEIMSWLYYCGLRPTLIYVLTSRENWDIVNGLHASSPPHSAPEDKVPWPNNPPYQTDQVPLLFIPVYWVSVPSEPSKFKLVKNLLPWEPGAPHPLETTSKSVPNSSWLFILFPSEDRPWMWCPPLPGCQYRWWTNCCQTHLSSVRWVFGVPQNSRVVNPSHTNGMNRR